MASQFGTIVTVLGSKFVLSLTRFFHCSHLQLRPVFGPQVLTGPPRNRSPSAHQPKVPFLAASMRPKACPAARTSPSRSPTGRDLGYWRAGERSLGWMGIGGGGDLEVNSSNGGSNASLTFNVESMLHSGDQSRTSSGCPNHFFCPAVQGSCTFKSNATPLSDYLR